MCERLTFYSVGANTVLFGTSVLKYSSTDAAHVANIFTGVVYLLPLLGGFVSDAWAGKFRTIVGAGFLYTLGLVLLPASAIDYQTLFGQQEDGSYYDLSVDTRRALFLSGLTFIALGTGGIKANVGPFGAQQLVDNGEGAVQAFFNWFYWFINVGSLIAYTGVAYIQQEVSFAWGFFVPLISMVIAIIIFIAAQTLYIHKPPGGSILATSVLVCCQVCVRRRPVLPPGHKRRVFDKAKKQYGGSFDSDVVDSVKSVLAVIPVFITVIMYWAIYAQMTTTFFFQGERMDVRVGGINIPASGLNAFNTIIIIILIPIVDRGLYPFLQRIGRPLTHLQRMGIGFLLAALSVVVAGVVEIARKDRMHEAHGVHMQELGGEKFNASDLSVFAQVSEYALVGASEAPKSMQGVVTGLFYVASGLGSFVSDGILNAVKAASKDYPWFDDEINNAHVEYFFFLLAGLMLLDFLVFLVIARFYRYRKPSPEGGGEVKAGEGTIEWKEDLTHL
ncbi:hypothetical protein C0Q70_02205 [Pomacea canaliculata]|uniref:Major facilitator superfamily (MFS) profile domain-containing protein n=1 Tax=Pomacea canaliculata TaxID=400727 RepID=A0A2T7Q1Q0_POMCA|nr:hypothetical protein C0Q70_02205 [Pomacea canaliculata]